MTLIRMMKNVLSRRYGKFRLMLSVSPANKKTRVRLVWGCAAAAPPSPISPFLFISPIPFRIRMQLFVKNLATSELVLAFCRPTLVKPRPPRPPGLGATVRLT